MILYLDGVFISLSESRKKNLNIALLSGFIRTTGAADADVRQTADARIIIADVLHQSPADDNVDTADKFMSV